MRSSKHEIPTCSDQRRVAYDAEFELLVGSGAHDGESPSRTLCRTDALAVVNDAIAFLVFDKRKRSVSLSASGLDALSQKMPRRLIGKSVYLRELSFLFRFIGAPHAQSNTMVQSLGTTDSRWTFWMGCDRPRRVLQRLECGRVD